MKIVKALTLLTITQVVFTSCLPESTTSTPADSTRSDSNPSTTSAAPTPTPVPQEEASVDDSVVDAFTSETVIATKNFNQLNATYSKLTGVPSEDSSISSEFQSIKTQLPTVNTPQTLNAFNQIAITRLAFAYCDRFIDTHQNFRSLNYNAINANSMATMLLNHFMDSAPQDIPGYTELYNGLVGILNNTDNLVPSNDKESMAKMGCVGILASGHITLL